jgi:hypothetical protein
MPDQNQEQHVPSKEELMKFFQEQIDVKKLQVELQELNAAMATARAEELKALSFIAQMTNPETGQPQATKKHIVTQQDLDANPELVDAGVQVGQEVLVPAGIQTDEDDDQPMVEAKSRKLKKEKV